MAEDITKILDGKATIYIADVGTALPTITGTLGSTITWTNWNSTGFLADDCEISVIEEVTEIKPYGKPAPVKIIRKTNGAKGKFSLLQSDSTALKMALSDDTEGTTVSDNSDLGEVTYKTIAFVTNNMVFHFKKVRIKANFTLKFDDAGVMKIPVEFVTVLKTDDPAGEQLWKFHTRTAAQG